MFLCLVVMALVVLMGSLTIVVGGCREMLSCRSHVMLR